MIPEPYFTDPMKLQACDSQLRKELSEAKINVTYVDKYLACGSGPETQIAGSIGDKEGVKTWYHWTIRRSRSYWYAQADKRGFPAEEAIKIYESPHVLGNRYLCNVVQAVQNPHIASPDLRDPEIKRLWQLSTPQEMKTFPRYVTGFRLYTQSALNEFAMLVRGL